MAFEIMNNVSQSITAAIEVVVGQIREVLMISSLIGSCVVYCAAKIAAFLFSAGVNLCSVIHIVCEDFMTFLFDVFDLILGICELSAGLLYFTIEAIVAVLTELKDVAVYILVLPILFYYKSVSFCETVAVVVVNAADLFKRSLTLIGTSIWVTLLCIPYSLAKLINVIILGCINVACAIDDFIVDLTTGTFSRMSDISCKMIHFCVDVPGEACGGLVMGILLMWLIYKEKRVIKTFCSYVYQLHFKAMIMLIQFVSYPCRCLVHQVDLYRRYYVFRRRNQNYQSVTDELPENEIDLASASQQNDNSHYMNLKKKLEKEIGDMMCSVCQERRKNVIVLPCRHLCMCEECVLIVERISRKCPLCRCHIVKTMGVYL